MLANTHRKALQWCTCRLLEQRGAWQRPGHIRHIDFPRSNSRPDCGRIHIYEHELALDFLVNVGIRCTCASCRLFLPQGDLRTKGSGIQGQEVEKDDGPDVSHAV